MHSTRTCANAYSQFYAFHSHCIPLKHFKLKYDLYTTEILLHLKNRTAKYILYIFQKFNVYEQRKSIPICTYIVCVYIHSSTSDILSIFTVYRLVG